MVAATALAALATATSVFCASLPGVGDALARVHRRLGAHHGHFASVSPSSRIARALIATEDERFYDHGPVDGIAILRALWSTATTQADGGGSTITQQLAKVLYVRHPNTLIGRVQAVGLATRLEHSHTKAQLLELYLNAVYFGHGAYGVGRASRTFFHRPPGALSWAQASLLAGLPQAPAAYDPLAHYALARRRQREVLDRLVSRRELTPAGAARVFAQAPLAR